MISPGDRFRNIDAAEEQRRIQADKMQNRLLLDYSHYFFKSYPTRQLPSPVSDFLAPFSENQEPSFESVLKGLAKQSETPITWVDMGSGRGLALRQAINSPELSGKLLGVGVDLLDYDLDELKPSDKEVVDSLLPPDHEAPMQLTSNIESVELPIRPEIITSIESIQYLSDPLGAIARWYNQLADNGLLMIATKHQWSTWVRFDRTAEQKENPMFHLLLQLKQAGVPHAFMDEPDWDNGVRPLQDPNEFRTLVIQKVPGTMLEAQTDLTYVWLNHHGYKASYYKPSVAGEHLLKLATSRTQ